MNELISIIVPVYNMELYIRRCLESLLHQRYNNIQIIVVNDGGTDASLDIVMQYQKKDSRIELYTKSNGGLSSARNFGMKYARGNYVCFVDSDDWVTEDYIYILYQGIINHEADLSCAGFQYAYDNRFDNYKFEMKSITLNQKQALRELCKDQWLTSHMWNKLYRKELFDNLGFEEGRAFEDIFIQHQLFARAKKIVCIDRNVYFYFMRNDSIIHDPAPQNAADHFVAYYRRLMFLNDDICRRMTLKGCIWTCYDVLYCVDQTQIHESDLVLANSFWEKYKKTKFLGINNYLRLNCPGLFKFLRSCKNWFVLHK